MYSYEVFFYSLLFFILGILFFNLNLGYFALFINLLIFFLFLFLFLTLKNKKFIFLSLLSIFIFIGIFYAAFYDHFFNLQNKNLENKTDFTGTVKKIISFEPYLLFILKEKNLNFLVKIEPYFNLKEGDKIKIFVQEKNKREKIPTFLKGEKILGYFVFPKVLEIKEPENFYGKILSLKNKLVLILKETLPFKEAAFLGGLIFGIKNNFPLDFKLAMQKSGTTHLVALSGYNISLIVVFLMFILSFFLKRFLAILLTIGGIILFVIAVGGEASVLRAAIMGILIILAQEKGNLFDVRNIIIFSAFLMLFFNPYLLVFDVGFILSFLSLLGIVYLKPLLFNSNIDLNLDKDKVYFLNWKESFEATVSAQLMVLPVLLSVFGNFSLVSFLTNILILWLIPLTMLLGFLIIFVSLFSKFFALFLSWIVYPFLKLETLIIDFFGNLNFNLEVKFNFLIFVLYYLLLALFILWKKKLIKI